MFSEEEVNWCPKGSSGWSPLHMAAACGDMKGLLTLLDQVKESEKHSGSASSLISTSSSISSSSSSSSSNSSSSSSARRKSVGGKYSSDCSKLELESSTGDRAFHVALRNGQALAARELARAGCDVHAKGKNGETGAHICAALDLAEELTWMMENKNLDPRTLTDKGETIIHFAARHCRISFLEWVVTQPFATFAFFSIADKNGDTCLHEAAKCGVRNGVQWLMDYLDKAEKVVPDCDPLTLFQQNANKRDPCMVARMEGHYFVAAMLDSYKAKKQSRKKTRRQKTKQLSSAIEMNNLRSVQSIVKKNSRYFNIIDSHSLKTGSNAVLDAAGHGNLEMFVWLLEQPGERQLVNAKTKQTVLHRAVTSGSCELVQYILEKNLVDADLVDANMQSALDLANSLGFSELVNILDTSNQAASDPPPRRVLSGRQQEEDRRLKEWLLHLDLMEWYERLLEEGFDSLSRLSRIEEEDLTDWGMKKGHRRSFIQAVQEWKSQNPLPSPLPSSPPPAAGPTPSPAPSTTSQTSASPVSENPLNSQKSNVKRVLFEDLDASRCGQDLRDGEQVEIDGRTDGNAFNPMGEPRTYVLKRTGNVYECSCGEWRLQTKVEKRARSCKHLRAYRGGQVERRRIELQLNRQFDMRELRSALSRKVSSYEEEENENEENEQEITTTELNGNEVDSNNIQSQPSLNRSQSAMSSRPSISSGSFRSSASFLQHEYSGVPPHQILSFDELTFGQIIGTGSFGIVRAAEWRGMLVAVKELRSERFALAGVAGQETPPPPTQEEEDGSSAVLLGIATPATTAAEEAAGGSEEWDLSHEAAMLSRVSNHENIVPFIGVLLSPRPCVVTKLMRRGSVEDMLVVPGQLYRRHKISKEMILDMLIDAAAGVLHLHSEGVIHRDIAARNLLVDENFRVRVADFGFARIKEMNRSKGYTNQNVGPIKWMAPEAMRFRVFSEQSDVYSFGVTLFEVLAGQRPWDGVESMDVVYRICAGEHLELPTTTENWHQILHQLVKDCQSKDPENRPRMRDVHKMLVSLRTNGSDSILSKLLKPKDEGSEQSARESDGYDKFPGASSATTTTTSTIATYVSLQEEQGVEDGSNAYHGFPQSSQQENYEGFPES